jgi:hypothetical protein
MQMAICSDTLIFLSVVVNFTGMPVVSVNCRLSHSKASSKPS